MQNSETSEANKPKERMKAYQWVAMICWPILMITGLYFMVNFHTEVLGAFGCAILVVGLIVASIFIFGKVDNAD